MATTLNAGHRLYRRSAYEITVEGRTGVPPTPVSVYACGFYPLSELLAAYAARGELIGGLPYVTGLDYSLLSTDGDPAVRDGYYASGSFPLLGAAGYVCGDFLTGEMTPAVEPIAPTTRVAPTAGWNAGAVSAAAFFRQGRVKFRVQTGKRFLVGLGDNVDPLSLDGRFIGWTIDNGYAADLWRQGGGAEGSLTPGGGAMGTYVPADDTTIYTVELLRGKMTFTRADRANTTSSYQTSVPLDAPGVWMLSAALWEPGSWVEGIEVVAYSGADLTLPPLAGRAGQGTPFSGGVLALPRLTITEARTATRADLTLPKMQLLGGRAICQAMLTLPALAVVSQEELLLATAPRANLELPTLTMSAHSVVGTVARAVLELPLMKARLTQGMIGEALLELPAMRGFAYTLPAGEGWMTSITSAVPTLGAFTEVFVVIDASGALSTVMGVSVIKDAALVSEAGAAATFQLSAVLTETLISQVLTGTDAADDGVGEVWAVNLGETPASSTFENYPFNSFGVIAGQAYGLREDGLFALTGDDDHGAPIRASVSFGAQDFNSKTLKHMARAYTGASSTGRLFLKITAEGAEHIYAARAASPELQQQRFDVGRGLKANYFTFELFNRDGDDFEIDSVTFVAAEFKRRI